MEPKKLILDPTQYKEFGLNFFESENFSVRYQLFNRLFWKNLYVAFGPIANDIEGFKKSLDYLSKFKFTKIKIDLPLILNEEVKKELTTSLLQKGYKKSAYVQDEETLLVSPNNFSLNSRNMRYVRKGLNNYNIEIKTTLNESELDSIYGIYVESAKQIGFTPKSIEAFKAINQKTITSLAFNKLTNNIDGFLMGYINNNLIDEDVLQLIFTGVNIDGRANKLGFALHHELFKTSFETHGVKMIDFHGASRSKNRSYTAFKENFGGEFVALPSSFEKINIL